jgi:hypothetical protein
MELIDLSQYTSDEVQSLMLQLLKHDALNANEEALSPSIVQQRELYKLRLYYAHQAKVLETQMIHGQYTGDDLLNSMLAKSRAEGCVEVINYLLQLHTVHRTPTQQSEE